MCLLLQLGWINLSHRFLPGWLYTGYMKWRSLEMAIVRFVQFWSNLEILPSRGILIFSPLSAVSCTLRPDVQVTWISQACSQRNCETGKSDFEMIRNLSWRLRYIWLEIRFGAPSSKSSVMGGESWWNFTLNSSTGF